MLKNSLSPNKKKKANWNWLTDNFEFRIPAEKIHLLLLVDYHDIAIIS